MPETANASDLRRPAARRRALAAATLAATLAAPAVRASEQALDLPAAAVVPAFLTLQPHEVEAVEPDWAFDPLLQRRVDRAVSRLGLDRLVGAGKLALALIDLNRGARPAYAEVNGNEMMYAASVPKIGVLYAAFQAQQEGKIRIDRSFRQTLTDMIRVSSNAAASTAIQRLGFDYIASVLWQSRLYDPSHGGGLWVGKAYGGFDDYWHRDPIANTSHGATAMSVAKLLTLLAQDRLVGPAASRDMKEILGNPGIHHKFVKGLERARPGSRIFRKSGSWRQWHGDAALVERGGTRYVAVALCEDGDGSQILERLIVELDDCVAGPARSVRTGPRAF